MASLVPGRDNPYGRGIYVKNTPTLQGRPPGDKFDEMNERLVKLEAQMASAIVAIGELRTDVRELRSDARGDFRVLFGALIVATLGLAGLIAKGFKWL